MAHEWQEMRLADCMDAIIDYRGKTPKKTESGIPLITAKIIKNGRIEPVSEFIAEDDYDSWMRRGMPLPGDIVMTTEAPLGEIAQLDNRKIALAQRVITLRGKRGLLDNTFLKYLMISNYVQHQLDGRGTGTTVKGIKQSELREVLLKFPPFSVQKQIANILGSLDEKIETNRQTNQTLEAMAQALFKSWFVDFDPVIDNALAAGHEIPPELQARAEARKSLQARAEQRQASLSGDRSEQESGDILPESIRQLFPNRFVLDAQMGWIPEGWKASTIEHIVKRLKVPRRYKKKDTLDHGTIPVYEQGAGILLGYHNHDAEFKASPEQPMFIFGDHTCVTKLSAEPFSISENVIALEGEGFNTYWVYYAIQGKQSFEEYRRHWMEFIIKPVILPSRALTDEFAKFVFGITQKSQQIRSENSSLSQLRDTLLPKLISGELRLPDEQPAKTVTT